MFSPQITTSQWLLLPFEVRQYLVTEFKIPRSSYTLVQDNKVMADGYTHDDLATITIEKMQHFTGSKETNFYTLFDQVFAVIEEKRQAKTQLELTRKAEEQEAEVKALQEITAEQITNQLTDVAKQIVKNRGGRPRKNPLPTEPTPVITPITEPELNQSIS